MEFGEDTKIDQSKNNIRAAISGKIAKKINRLMKMNGKDSCEKAKKILKEREDEYEKNRPKKWGVAGLGLAIGAILGLQIPRLYKFATNTLFDRSGIESLLEDYLGGQNITQTLFDDMLIVAYEYNS